MEVPSVYGISMKWVAFCLLVGQTVLVLAFMRLSRLYSEDKYIMSTAVVMCELLKLLASAGLLWRENIHTIKDEDGKSTMLMIKEGIVGNPSEMMKIGIPGLLYVVQNNLLFVALNNLTTPTYQVTYQLKIVTTAFMSAFLLNKAYSKQQWTSIFVLTLGVSIIQYKPGAAGDEKKDSLFGIFVVLCACLTSAGAGVTLEKLLKQSSDSIWLRNIQLSVFGIILGLVVCLIQDFSEIRAKGFFFGYNIVVWLSVLLHGAGGLVVALVLKYADNILKCFGNTVAIVFSCLISWLLMNDFEPSVFFVFGTTLVCMALYAYNIPEAPIQVANAWMGIRDKVLAHGFGSGVSQIEVREVLAQETDSENHRNV